MFGYTLHLLVTLNGGMLDVQLAPANVADIMARYQLLAGHREVVVIGDTAALGKQRAAELHGQIGTIVMTGAGIGARRAIV